MQQQPSLSPFADDSQLLQTARDEIIDLQTTCDIGWIRVDLEPVKQVLITHASKWMWTFTSYLADQVTHFVCLKTAAARTTIATSKQIAR